jgi:hypothetical protein
MIEEHIAYLKVKEGYAAHHNYCDSHCHHSEYWYQHAGYYYYEYREHVMKIELLGLQ